MPRGVNPAHRPVRTRGSSRAPDGALATARRIMLGLYALCVWPANIKHAVDHIFAAARSGQLVVSRTRLALQPVLRSGGRCFCSGTIDGPWRPSRDG